MLRFFILISFVFALFLNSVNSYAIENKQCIKTEVKTCNDCNSCASSETGFKLPFNEFPFAIVALAIGVLLLVKKNKQKILFWTLGLAIFIGLAFSAVDLQNQKKVNINLSQKTAAIQDKDNTKDIEQVFTESKTNGADEFEPISDTNEFQTFSATDSISNVNTKNADIKRGLSENERNILFQTAIALLVTLITGFAFKYYRVNNERRVVLLASLVYFGFYIGGCPCMISSFESLIFFLLGQQVLWVNLLWILGLLVLTYFFGKIWCGWVCHLGAFQEFLYKPWNKTIILNTKIQKGLKIIRLAAFLALLVQLIVTRTMLFEKIDPFKVAFNQHSANVTGYVLLVILLISSLFIYRPFCKAFCPVGLVMSWMEKIPGASTITIDKHCSGCKHCKKNCHYHAITGHHKGELAIDNCECIRCGDCFDSCKVKSIYISGKK